MITGGAGWPPTFLALLRGGPPIVAATDGSSSPRPPTQPDASTAAFWVRARHRQRPDVPQAAALSHATTGEPSGVGSDELSDNALNCPRRGNSRNCRI